MVPTGEYSYLTPPVELVPQILAMAMMAHSAGYWLLSSSTPPSIYSPLLSSLPPSMSLQVVVVEGEVAKEEEKTRSWSWSWSWRLCSRSGRSC